MMDLSNIEITNYVADNGELVKISPVTISLSKNLIKLNEIGDKENNQQ